MLPSIYSLLFHNINVLRSYSMLLSLCLQDKVGPFARSAADAAVVLDAIRGRDPGDPSSFDFHMDDPFSLSIQNLTVGYLPQTPATVSNS